MNFEPLIGFTYHLYERREGDYVLSMVSPRNGKEPALSVYCYRRTLV